MYINFIYMWPFFGYSSLRPSKRGIYIKFIRNSLSKILWDRDAGNTHLIIFYTLSECGSNKSLFSVLVQTCSGPSRFYCSLLIQCSTYLAYLHIFRFNDYI